MMCFSDFCRRWAVGWFALVPTLAWAQGTYTTNFPLTENPLSESGKWINGGTTGLDWTNVRTTPGLAFGTQTGSIKYNDSTAVLAGPWGPTQTAQATVAVTSASGASGVFEEVALRLRTTITAHSITGYEINCAVSTTQNYIQIVRWNGPFGSFTQLDGRSAGPCVNGDVLKATINGSTITVYRNGAAVFSVNDSTYTSGSPGVGLYLQGGDSSLNGNFGFSSFAATDGSANFTLSVTTSQTVVAGTNGTYTVNVTPSGGFTGTVNLSVSGQPSGSTAIFTPNSITTSGSSTLTISSSGSTPAGSYPITVNGASGNITHTASTAFVVSATSGSSSSGCDLNNDGTTNVLDVQLAVNKFLSCTTGPNVSSHAFVSQVTNGALGASCSVTAGAHTVFLSWTASVTSNTNYNIYRATTSGGYTTALNSSPVSGTGFADCTVSPGQIYYYVIRSVDASGNESINSNESVASIPSS
jgi:hypothetical protein